MQTEADRQPESGAMADFYEALQVSPKAEQEVIEAAYKRLALKYHPDLNATPEATRRMQELNAAYAILSNPERRVEYDLERPGPTPNRHPRHASYVRRRKAKAKSAPTAEQAKTPRTEEPSEPAADSSYDWAEDAFAKEKVEREWSYVPSRPRGATIGIMIGLLVALVLLGLVLFNGNQVSSSPNMTATSIAAALPPNVLFDDDLDTVAGANWLLESPWHLTDKRAASGTHSLSVGDEGKNSYRARLNATATLVRPVDLSNTQNPLMRFRLSGQFDSEIQATGRDWLMVEVAETNRDFEVAYSVSGAFPNWQDILVDLNKWKGKTVVIRFRFTSGPTSIPNYNGPLIDDVRIER